MAERQTSITFRCSAALKSALETLAAQEGRTLSNLAHKILADYVAERCPPPPGATPDDPQRAYLMNDARAGERAPDPRTVNAAARQALRMAAAALEDQETTE